MDWTTAGGGTTAGATSSLPFRLPVAPHALATTLAHAVAHGRSLQRKGCRCCSLRIVGCTHISSR